MDAKSDEKSSSEEKQVTIFAIVIAILVFGGFFVSIVSWAIYDTVVDEPIREQKKLMREKLKLAEEK